MRQGLQLIRKSKPSDLVSYFRTKLAAETDAASAVEIMTERPGSVQFVDVRSSEDFKAGHVKGAINIPAEDLEANIGKLDKDKPVMVHCYDHECLLSARVALQLAEKGFRVQDILGGFDGLKAKGAEIVN